MQVYRSLLAGLMVWLAVTAGAAQAGSLTYEILIDTSRLTPGPGGLIDMTLSPSNPTASPGSVSASIFNPITDGVVGPVSASSGTASGDLTMAGVMLGNDSSYSDLQQNFSVGSFFDVFVTLAGPEVGSGAMGPFSGTVFNLSVYDAGTGVATANLTVNPNIDGSGNPIIDGTVGTSTSGPNVVVTLLSPTVPEPPGVLLMGVGAAAVLFGTIKRRRVA